MYHFIVNPASKSGKGIEIWKDLTQVLKEEGIAYTEHLTGGVGDAARFASEIMATAGEEECCIVPLGGDGTLNETMQGIDHPEQITFGYIPSGSSNDFARATGISTDPRTCLAHILSKEHPVRFDIGEMKYISYEDDTRKVPIEKFTLTRRFMVSCGMGFDAGVCEEAMDSSTKDFLNKLHLGKLTYGSIALHQFREGAKGSCTITIDDGTPIRMNRVLFAVGMNTCYEGGGFKFCPEASSDDGLLDVCVAHELNLGRVLNILPGAFNGKLLGKPGISHFKASTLRLQSDVPLWVHTDGEVQVMATEIEMCCNKYHTTFYV